MQKFLLNDPAAVLNSCRYMRMLRNVIFSFRLKGYGAIKLISWKYTFKRLNEEYDIAKRKKQALDKLFETGKISQSTRDSFNGEINAAIATIEKQQKELIESMQGKTQELENQIKTLETLLANYEIQHVVGEIDEEIYQKEISLLTTGLETTKNELSIIKQVTNQLSPTTPTIQMPAALEPIAQVAEAEIAQPAAVEPIPVEVQIEAATVETVIEPTLIETAPAEIQVETVKAEAAPVESPPMEVAPVESTPIETAQAPMEVAPVESTPIETAPIENTPAETAPIVEVATVETPFIEIAQTETAPIVSPEPEVQVVNETAPEIVPQEPTITEPEPQEAIINMDATAPIEQPTIEAETTVVTTSEVIDEPTPEQPTVEVPLQDFEVTEPATVETTLEKVIEPIMEPMIVEETIIQAHPLEAPQGAQTEVVGQSHVEVATAAETEDSSKEKSE